MIKSMTAFASNETEIGNITINCELRSVNHRYLDITLKLPDRWKFVETNARAAISSVVNRGKLECMISYKKPSKDSANFLVSIDAVKALMVATETIEQHMTAPLSFSALDVLAFPGVQQEPETDKEELINGITKLVEETLTELVSVREREGAQLRLLIEERCQKMQYFVVQASERLPEVLRIIRYKLKERINELVIDPNFDRLEQELVFLTQKLDITEELDRLNTHISEVLRVMQQNEPVGRRLDFLMQELNREANTLGSKSADKEMTQISIELKVLIEQMREQIQNIE